VLKDGQVAEQGTHGQLNDRGGLYSELWSAQEMISTEEKDESTGKDGEEVVEIVGKGKDVK
jgi:ATP-binding cassette subfamily B (MDR/TAP) protein 7